MDQRLVAASLLYCASKIPAIPNIEEQGDDEKRVEIKVSREIELLESEMDRKSVKKIKEEIVQRKSKLDLVKNQIAAIELQKKEEETLAQKRKERYELLTQKFGDSVRNHSKNSSVRKEKEKEEKEKEPHQEITDLDDNSTNKRKTDVAKNLIPKLLSKKKRLQK